MTLLAELYHSEEQIGWSMGMRAITHTLLSGQPMLDGPLLEIGCGGGTLLAELSYSYPTHPAVGIDLHPQALAYARKRQVELCASKPALLAQADLHTLPFADKSFAAILALDVLDQAGVDLAAGLAECHRLLLPRGLLLLRVSAHAWLTGSHDAAFNTGHRYSRAELNHALRQSGFQIVRATYANMLLALPVGWVRLLQRWQLLPLLPTLYRHSPANSLFYAVLRREALWMKRHNLPAGLSLYLLARQS